MFELTNFVSILCTTSTPGANAVDPLYQALTVIGPYAIGVFVALGLIYGVIVGVKFAKAESADERKNLQKALVNGVIGFIAIIVLISVLYAIREPLVRWINS